MQEIFRAQIRQILGGRMKWLMGVSLVLPVLLTLGASTSGGLGEIQAELEGERLRQEVAAGVLPDDLEPVVWNGEDKSYFGGYFRLTEEGLWNRDDPIGPESVMIVNGGDMIIRAGELWVHPDLDEDGPLRVHHRRRTEPQSSAGPALTVRAISAAYLFILYPQVVCLLLALLYGTSVLSHELDGKTLPYLFTRPLPRWQFVLGKYLGIVTSLAVPTCASLVAAWLIIGGSDVPLLATLLAGTVAALCAYNAVFILFGFLTPRRGMIVALIYGVLFELILSFVPALVNQFTVTYYLRSLVVELLDVGIPREITRIVGGASLTLALLALLAIAVVTLGLSSTLAARREYVVKDEA